MNGKWMAVAKTCVSVVGLTAVLAVGAGCKKIELGKGSDSPEDTELAYQRGTLALEQGRYSDAITELQTVLDARPTDTTARYNLGVALQRVHSYRESIEVLTTWGDRQVDVRKLDLRIKVPTDADGDYLYALGTSYQEMRLFDKAQVCFDVAVSEFPDHLPSRYGRAMVLQERGRLDEARKAWVDYLQRDANSAWSDGARRHLRKLEEQEAH